MCAACRRVVATGESVKVEPPRARRSRKMRHASLRQRLRIAWNAPAPRTVRGILGRVAASLLPGLPQLLQKGRALQGVGWFAVAAAGTAAWLGEWAGVLSPLSLGLAATAHLLSVVDAWRPLRRHYHGIASLGVALVCLVGGFHAMPNVAGQILLGLTAAAHAVGVMWIVCPVEQRTTRDRLVFLAVLFVPIFFGVYFPAINRLLNDLTPVRMVPMWRANPYRPGNLLGIAIALGFFVVLSIALSVIVSQFVHYFRRRRGQGGEAHPQ